MRIFSNKKYILIFILSVFVSVTALLGGSYALIQRVLVGSNVYSFKTGNFLVEFNDSNEITLSNSIPVYDDVGINNGDEFIFSVINNGSYISSYSIKIEDMSSDNLGDVIRYAVDYGDGYSYDNIFAYKDNKYIIQNKSLEIASTDTYKLRFWLDIDTDESYIYKEGTIDTPKQFIAKVQIESTQEEYKYASNVLDSVYNQENEEGLKAINSDGLLHADGKIREYRYSGSNVNNYVWFNCKDGYTKGNEHCEKWRIIGSFDNTYENGIGTYKMLKIVKDDALIQMKSYNNNDDSHANFDGSSIQNYLNNDYYNSLNKNAKELIMKAKWNIGNISNTNNGINNYNYEISRNNYNYIGLINSSDLGYSSDSSIWNSLLNTSTITTENNWLYQDNSMIINTPNIEGTKMYYISSNGLAEGDTTVNYKVRPSLYLKPDVSIINGFGTEENPYELSIKYPIKYNLKTIPKLKVDGINLNKTNNTIYVNSNTPFVNLNATLLPSNEISTDAIWSSTDSNIATVDQSGKVTAKNPGITDIVVTTNDGRYSDTLRITVKKKVIIVIGASQVERMKWWVKNYSSDLYNYSYKESDNSSTLNYFFESGSGFDYQVGVGWNNAESLIESYSSNKEYVEFHVFFPLIGNSIKGFTCNEITTSNTTIIDIADTYNNLISSMKSSGYNIQGYVVSMHPVVFGDVSDVSNSSVVENEDINSCAANYRSNLKYFTFNKTVRSIVEANYSSNLIYEQLLIKIVQVNAEGTNYPFKLPYKTIDGVHWDQPTTIMYVDLMLKESGNL